MSTFAKPAGTRASRLNRALTFNADTERSKREVGAKAVAYVVGRYRGLGTSDAAFYQVVCEPDNLDAVREQL